MIICLFRINVDDFLVISMFFLIFLMSKDVWYKYIILVIGISLFYKKGGGGGGGRRWREENGRREGGEEGMGKDKEE